MALHGAKYDPCETKDESCLAKKFGMFAVCMGQTIVTSQYERRVSETMSQTKESLHYMERFDLG